MSRRKKQEIRELKSRGQTTDDRACKHCGKPGTIAVYNRADWTSLGSSGVRKCINGSGIGWLCEACVAKERPPGIDMLAETTVNDLNEMIDGFGQEAYWDRIVDKWSEDPTLLTLTQDNHSLLHHCISRTLGEIRGAIQGRADAEGSSFGDVAGWSLYEVLVKRGVIGGGGEETLGPRYAPPFALTIGKWLFASDQLESWKARAERQDATLEEVMASATLIVLMNYNLIP